MFTRNVIAALIITLVSAGAPLLSYFLHPKVAFVHLQIDDPYYLATLRDLGMHQAPEGFFLEHKKELPLSELLTQRVSSPVEYLIAWVFQKIGFSASGVGLCLDFLSIFFGSLLFLHFYAAFATSFRTVVIATITTLFFPDLFQLRIFGDQLFFDRIVSPKFLPEDPPIIRSVVTQLSYLAYGGTLILLSKISKEAGEFRKRLMVLAGLIAAQFYIYFFSWASSIFVSFFFLLFSIPRFSREQRGQLLSPKTLLSSCALFLLLMVPGFWLLKQVPDAGISTATEIRNYFAFPIESALLVLFLGAGLLLGRVGPTNRTVMLLAIALLCSEFPLLNLQPILGVGLAPYHFSVFYLRPVFGGLCIVLLESFLERFPFFILRWSISGIIVSLFLWVSVRGVRNAVTPDLYLSELEELIHFLDTEVSPSAVIASMYHWKPFQEEITEEVSIRIFPQLVYLLSKKQILASEWAISSKVKDKEVFHRELLTGFLFSGKMQLIWPCLNEMPKLPGDLFTCTWSYYLLRRWQQCSQNLSEIQSYSVCQGLRDFQVDYVLYDTELRNQPLPEPLLPYFEKALATRNNGFLLYRFLQDKYLREQCS